VNADGFRGKEGGGVEKRRGILTFAFFLYAGGGKRKLDTENCGILVRVSGNVSMGGMGWVPHDPNKH